MKLMMEPPGEDWVCDRIINEFWDASRHAYERVKDSVTAECLWHYAKWVANRCQNDPCGQPGHKPTITSVHHIVPGKQLDVSYFDAITDIYHVPNEITARQLRGCTRKPDVIRVVPYWTPKIMENHYTPPHASICDGKVVVGSFQRDTEGASMGGRLQPKLEKGPDILARVINSFAIGDIVAFIGGWRRDWIREAIKEHSVVPTEKWPYNDVPALYGRLMHEKGTYLVTSRFEGGPQAILEASSQGCPILSTDVGMASMVLHPSCIIRGKDDDEVVHGFVAALKDGGHKRPEVIQFNAARAWNEFSIEALLPRYHALVAEAVYVAHLHQP